MKELGNVGLIARFKPLHNGAAAMLESIVAHADHITIGIGSSNKYNARNPFTALESEGMIHALLDPLGANYDIVHIPDFAQEPGCEDGSCWKEYMTNIFGALDSFVSGNPYVNSLLEDTYQIVNPVDIIPLEHHVRLRATEVRLEMARGDDWQDLVPKPVAEYITSLGLDERFREEFGLETLSEYALTDYRHGESAAQEKAHAMER